MTELFSLSNIVEQIRFLNDYPPNSILLLFKKASNAPNNERYQVLMFEMQTGKKPEMFSIMIANPDFDGYFVYPKHSIAYNTDLVKKQFDALPKDNLGNSYMP